MFNKKNLVAELAVGVEQLKESLIPHLSRQIRLIGNYKIHQQALLDEVAEQPANQKD